MIVTHNQINNIVTCASMVSSSCFVQVPIKRIAVPQERRNDIFSFFFDEINVVFEFSKYILSKDIKEQQKNVIFV